jgi:tRNA pseudouridine38-40 synthase
LPQDIRVIKSQKASDNFDACRGAKRKTYVYSAYLAETERPLKERYAVRLDENLNVSAMQKACAVFLGEHDFKGFCSSGSSIKTTVRKIYSLTVDFNGEDLIFTVTGNGFLYNMVRTLVGTLIKMEKGELTIETAKEILLTGNRKKVGKTYPAKGLKLKNVIYA